MQDNNEILLNPRHGWLGFWPKTGIKAIIDPENAFIFEFILEQRQQMDDQICILDAGAGEQPYSAIFKGLRYESTDMPGGFYKNKQDFECELHDIPKPNNYYDVILLTQVLEHVPNPQAILFEINRVLKPNGKLLISVPLNGPLHGEPWHFFQFTHHALNQLAINTNFHINQIEKVGGAFWFIGKMLPVAINQILKQYDPFRAKKRGQNVLFSSLISFLLLPIWFIFYLPAAYIIRPLFYWLDYLDRQKILTTGYTAVFIKNLDK
jgi:SAM-dependent methyltransferase